jgi:hypothetical protein
VKKRGGRERKRDKMGRERERERVKRERVKSMKAIKIIQQKDCKRERKIGRVNERMNENKTKRVLLEKEETEMDRK